MNSALLRQSPAHLVQDLRSQESLTIYLNPNIQPVPGDIAFSNSTTICIRRTKLLAYSEALSQYVAAVASYGDGDQAGPLVMTVYVQANKHQKAYLLTSVHYYIRSAQIAATHSHATSS